MRAKALRSFLLLPLLLAPRARAQQDSGGMAALFGPGNGVHGAVTAIAGNDLTVKDEQGQLYKIETGPNTHFRKNRQPVKIGDLHVGDVVVAAGEQDEKARALGAVFVLVLDPQEYEKARAGFGKTWTAGTVQSIKDLEITIQRPDNITQTIAVDENTSFRKRRDSITLGDIKVGDHVSARGAEANGKFQATVLSVMEPREPGQRGQGQTGQGQTGQGQRGQGQTGQGQPRGDAPAPPNGPPNP